MKAWVTVGVLLLATRTGFAQSDAPDDVKVGDVIWAPAIAEPAPGSEQPPPKREAHAKRWYGEPILVGDGIAYSCLLLAVAFDMKETYQVFIPPVLVSYPLVGPTTHAAHGNWGRAGASLAIRLGTPLATLAMGATACAVDQSDCVGTLVVFGVLGMAGASAIDIAALARERVPPPERVSWVTPTLSLTRQHALLGAAGSF